MEGLCSCGKRFGDISGATRDQIGKTGWAHTAHLTAEEYQQIAAERDRIWALVVNSSLDSPPTVVEAPPEPILHDDAYFGTTMA